MFNNIDKNRLNRAIKTVVMAVVSRLIALAIVFGLFVFSQHNIVLFVILASIVLFCVGVYITYSENNGKGIDDDI